MASRFQDGHIFKKSHGITFEEWMARVTAVVFFRSGMTPNELSNYDYEAAYDRDNPPAITASDAIRHAPPAQTGTGGSSRG